MHKTTRDLLCYLSQSMVVTKNSVLVLISDPDYEIQHLDAICQGDILILKD